MGFIQEVRSHRNRTWKSVCVSLLFTALGFHSAAFGPSLIDLSIQVGTTVDQITHILPVRAFGNMIGSTLCGFIISYFDLQVVLIFSMLSMSGAIAFVPLCSSVYQLYAVMLFNGISSGFLVNAGNCMVIHAWGKENSPFMQLAHFMFGIGAFICPFILEPFLKEINESDLTPATKLPLTTESLLTTESPSNATDFPNILSNIDPETLKLKYAFFIISGISFLVWIVFVITYLNKRSNKPHPTREVKVKKADKNQSVLRIEIINNEDSNNNQKTITSIASAKSIKSVENAEKEIKTIHKAVIVLLAALFIHLAYGLELSFGVMLASYARLSELHFDKSYASYLTSVYWFSFTFFRLITLVLINFISARSMLIICLTLIAISNSILIPLLWINNGMLLWVGSVFMGIGLLSSIYPTLWSFLETILPVTSKMTSIVNSCACVGEFIVPVLIGAYLDQYPNIFVYIVSIYSFLACFIFALACIWEFVINKYKRS